MRRAGNHHRRHGSLGLRGHPSPRPSPPGGGEGVGGVLVGRCRRPGMRRAGNHHRRHGTWGCGGTPHPGPLPRAGEREWAVSWWGNVRRAACCARGTIIAGMALWVRRRPSPRPSPPAGGEGVGGVLVGQCEAGGMRRAGNHHRRHGTLGCGGTPHPGPLPLVGEREWAVCWWGQREAAGMLRPGNHHRRHGTWGCGGAPHPGLLPLAGERECVHRVYAPRAGTISVRMPPALFGWKKAAERRLGSAPRSMRTRPCSWSRFASAVTSVEP